MEGFFQLQSAEGHARVGLMRTAHGSIETPAFMPVGTYGAVKTLQPLELVEIGTQILLGNTYHLYLRPGLEQLKNFGGLHRFMGWTGPILTDSGGFQAFSLGNLKKIHDEGVTFKSHLNGDLLFLTPELCAEIQQIIGSDIAMVLDECPPLPSPPEKLRASVERTLNWSAKFLSVPRRSDQAIFGIVQGGNSIDLRKESLERTALLPFEGLAIGGLSVGEPLSVRREILQCLAPELPQDVPHYLMGIGTPLDLLESVHFGIDLFDCVLPTRNGRNGGFFTDQGLLNIRNRKFQNDPNPIDPDCGCTCCQYYSRAYLRHLFQIKEILGCRLATIHNLYYYHRFVRRMRHAIREQRFEAFFQRWQPVLNEAYAKKTDAEGMET